MLWFIVVGYLVLAVLLATLIGKSIAMADQEDFCPRRRP